MNCVIALRDLQSKSSLRPIKPEGVRIMSLSVRKRQAGPSRRGQELNRRGGGVTYRGRREKALRLRSSATPLLPLRFKNQANKKTNHFADSRCRSASVQAQSVFLSCSESFEPGCSGV